MKTFGTINQLDSVGKDRFFISVTLRDGKKYYGVVKPKEEWIKGEQYETR
jgi:hypothetical protein